MMLLRLTSMIALMSVLAGAVEGAPVKGKKGKAKKAVAVEKPAVVEEKPVEKVESDPAGMRGWAMVGGAVVEGKFLAYESGVVTIEKAGGVAVRMPVGVLSAVDRRVAEECRARQEREPLSAEVVASAAARLDATIEGALKAAGRVPGRAVGDEVLVRRLYVDIAGRVPMRGEVEAFLADGRVDKRARLIDELLHSPGAAMDLFNWMADMLRVKDDPAKGAKAWLYEDWLKAQIAMNRPWDELVREMLTADGRLCENGATGFLLRDAQMPLDGVSNLLTTFLGANVACAQCHDHPFADWTQKDFYQMAAFFGATDGYHEDLAKKIRRFAKSGVVPKGAAGQMLGPNAFELVDGKANRLKYPDDYHYDNAKAGAKVEPALITWEKGDAAGAAYRVETGDPGKLRESFAAWLTHRENPRFAAAMANRLWQKVFGLAVQEPVGDLDDPKGAVIPELLTQIAWYLKQAKFDLREFQRILYNTAAYQREAASVPLGERGEWRFAGPLVRRMSAEQVWDSVMVLTEGTRVDDCLLRRGDELRLFALPGREVTAEVVKGMMARMESESVRPGVLAAAGGKGKKGRANARVNPKVLEASYEGRTPEQRGGMVLARASELPQPAPETHFLRLFGQSDRLVADSNTTDGSVPQALALMNGPVQEMVTAGSAVVMKDAAAAADDAGKVERLYRSFLGRAPEAAEKERAVALLGKGQPLGDVAWALLNSREFLFIR